jgi:GxxExxY protein
MSTELEEEMKYLNFVTERVIGCAIEVHRTLGPGLLEHTYEEGMCLEMDLCASVARP